MSLQAWGFAVFEGQNCRRSLVDWGFMNGGTTYADTAAGVLDSVRASRALVMAEEVEVV
jgi:hypothetical protein